MGESCALTYVLMMFIGLVKGKTMQNEPEDKKKNAIAPQGIGLGLGLGIAIGTSLGIAMDNLALGIGMGVAIGVAFGTSMSVAISKKKSDEDNQE
jgi:hypothetical protein